jgi:hypothetical protein
MATNTLTTFAPRVAEALAAAAASDAKYVSNLAAADAMRATVAHANVANVAARAAGGPDSVNADEMALDARNACVDARRSAKLSASAAERASAANDAVVREIHSARRAEADIARAEAELDNCFPHCIVDVDAAREDADAHYAAARAFAFDAINAANLAAVHATFAAERADKAARIDRAAREL